MDKNWRFLIISEIYPMIRAADPCWTVVIYGIIAALVTICGILSNLSVIFVTIRTKTLHGSTNILLAFYSFCEIVNLSANFLSMFAAFSGHYFIPLKNAFYFLLIPIVGSTCAINLMLFIGIERLFVVLFPLKTFRHKLFMAIVLKFCLLYAFVVVIIFIKLFDDSETTEILANYYELWQMIDCVNVAIPVSIFITLIIIIVYASIAIVLHCRKASSNANSAQQLNNRRIFRSLLIIIFVNVGGYFFGAAVSFFIIQPIFAENIFINWHFNKIFGILMHISASSNGPILYWTSSDYREAFQRNFAFLFNVFTVSSCKSPAVISPQN